MIDERGLPYAHRYVIGCRYGEAWEDFFSSLVRETDFEILGLIQHDGENAQVNFLGRDLLSLAGGNPALLAAHEKVRQALALLAAAAH